MCCGIANRYQQLMEEAVTLSMNHVHEGGIPFTALVIDLNGKVLGRGVNRVREHYDPTAHAEVETLPDACRRTRHVGSVGRDAPGVRRALHDLLHERTHRRDWPRGLGRGSQRGRRARFRPLQHVPAFC
jgi:Cytosine/adenosine deaminases